MKTLLKLSLPLLIANFLNAEAFTDGTTRIATLLEYAPYQLKLTALDNQTSYQGRVENIDGTLVTEFNDCISDSAQENFNLNCQAGDENLEVLFVVNYFVAVWTVGEKIEFFATPSQALPFSELILSQTAPHVMEIFRSTSEMGATEYSAEISAEELDIDIESFDCCTGGYMMTADGCKTFVLECTKEDDNGKSFIKFMAQPDENCQLFNASGLYTNPQKVKDPVNFRGVLDHI